MEVLSQEILRKLRLVSNCVAVGDITATGMATLHWYWVARHAPAKLTHASAIVSLLLLQATEAETKEDREIICEEVFCDITGQLDFAAKGVCCCSSRTAGQPGRQSQVWAAKLGQPVCAGL